MTPRVCLPLPNQLADRLANKQLQGKKILETGNWIRHLITPNTLNQTPMSKSALSSVCVSLDESS